MVKKKLSKNKKNFSKKTLGGGKKNIVSSKLSPMKKMSKKLSPRKRFKIKKRKTEKKMNAKMKGGKKRSRKQRGGAAAADSVGVGVGAAMWGKDEDEDAAVPVDAMVGMDEGGAAAPADAMGGMEHDADPGEEARKAYQDILIFYKDSKDLKLSDLSTNSLPPLLRHKRENNDRKNRERWKELDKSRKLTQQLKQTSMEKYWTLKEDDIDSKFKSGCLVSGIMSSDYLMVVDKILLIADMIHDIISGRGSDNSKIKILLKKLRTSFLKLLAYEDELFNRLKDEQSLPNKTTLSFTRLIIQNLKPNYKLRYQKEHTQKKNAVKIECEIFENEEGKEIVELKYLKDNDLLEKSINALYGTYLGTSMEKAVQIALENLLLGMSRVIEFKEDQAPILISNNNKMMIPAIIDTSAGILAAHQPYVLNMNSSHTSIDWGVHSDIPTVVEVIKKKQSDDDNYEFEHLLAANATSSILASQGSDIIRVKNKIRYYLMNIDYIDNNTGTEMSKLYIKVEITYKDTIITVFNQFREKVETKTRTDNNKCHSAATMKSYASDHIVKCEICKLDSYKICSECAAELCLKPVGDTTYNAELEALAISRCQIPVAFFSGDKLGILRAVLHLADLAFRMTPCVLANGDKVGPVVVNYVTLFPNCYVPAKLLTTKKNGLWLVKGSFESQHTLMKYAKNNSIVRARMDAHNQFYSGLRTGMEASPKDIKSFLKEEAGAGAIKRTFSDLEEEVVLEAATMSDSQIEEQIEIAEKQATLWRAQRQKTQKTQ